MKRFTETQAFPTVAYVVMGLTSALSISAVVFTQNWLGLSFVWFLTPLALAFNLLCQKTTVANGFLTVTFGAVPLYRRRFALPKITATEAVTYAPLAEYGGWGIRGWGRNIALNARGNRGVRLTLADGTRVLVGSQRPEELAQALTR